MFGQFTDNAMVSRCGHRSMERALEFFVPLEKDLLGDLEELHLIQKWPRLHFAA